MPAVLAQGRALSVVLLGMVTVYLSEIEQTQTVQTVRETLRTLARKAGKRYAQAKDNNGRVVATVEV